MLDEIYCRLVWRDSSSIHANVQFNQYSHAKTGFLCRCRNITRIIQIIDGHHHIGHIGILGLDRAGVENYQITLGGDGTETATVGERAGPGFAYDEIVPAIERLVRAYLEIREDPGETFLEAYRHGGSEEIRETNFEAIRAAYNSSSVETLSLGGTTAGVNERVRAVLSAMGKTPSELDQAGRMDVIRKLEDSGVFLIKGAAAYVATELHVSVPSVYRYLQKVRREG